MSPFPDKEIPDMSVDELLEEQQFWERRIADTPQGRCLAAAAEFSDALGQELRRRDRSAPNAS